jgi:large subunit ribosomal protein L9
MEIILLEKIQNVGEIGDLVNVKNGYARNYLIPQQKAMLATADSKAKVEERRRQLAEEEGKRLDGAKARAELSIKEITLTRLCGEEGQLYGSVSPVDIAEAMSESDISIEKSEITQPDGPIKHVGDFEADVILHPEVRFTVKIKVLGDHDGAVIDTVVEHSGENSVAGEEKMDETPAQEESSDA